MKKELLHDLLKRSTEEELGLVIETNNPHQMSARLLDLKRATGLYTEIEVTVPSTPNTVILVKKTTELDEPVYGDLPDV